VRETRLHGSEGGGTEANRSFLPYRVQPVSFACRRSPGSRTDRRSSCFTRPPDRLNSLRQGDLGFMLVLPRPCAPSRSRFRAGWITLGVRPRSRRAPVPATAIRRRRDPCGPRGHARYPSRKRVPADRRCPFLSSANPTRRWLVSRRILSLGSLGSVRHARRCDEMTVRDEPSCTIHRRPGAVWRASR